MSEPKELILPSGAVLKLSVAPFNDAKELYQAVLEEMKSLQVNPRDINFYKDIFCNGMSSKKIEKLVWTCAARCLYNDVKVAPSVFEPVECREDYVKVCWEVADINLRPFMKDLFAELSRLMGVMLVETSPE